MPGRGEQGVLGCFAELIDPEGSELYLKPADEYVEPGVPLNFYTVVEAARRRGEVAVGYRTRSKPMTRGSLTACD